MDLNVEFRGFTSDRNFGVELEVNEIVSKIAIKKIIESEDTTNPVYVDTGWSKSVDGNCWHIKRDSSCGYEVASYKGSGYADILNISNVADVMERNGCQVTKRCGLHIHADISDFDTSMVGVLLAYWVKIESIVLQACPKHRRHNRYCRNMRNKFSVDYRELNSARGVYELMRPQYTRDHDNPDKRVTLNIIPYVISLNDVLFKKSTAEIRMPEGTLSKRNVQNWTKFYIQFIDCVKNKDFPSNMDSCNLVETLQLLDFLGKGNSFYILGKELYETKKWFLQRIVEFTEHKNLYCEAIEMLNEISRPLENYPRVERVFP